MKATRRKITKAEREDRDGTMRKITLAKVLTVQRLLAGGWDIVQIADAYQRMEREVARHVLEQSKPDHHWCCEVDVADRVADAMTGGAA